VAPTAVREPVRMSTPAVNLGFTVTETVRPPEPVQPDPFIAAPPPPPATPQPAR
jgi:hypothetical protein